MRGENKHGNKGDKGKAQGMEEAEKEERILSDRERRKRMRKFSPPSSDQGGGRTRLP